MVTVNSGYVMSFDDTEGIQRDVSSLITMLSPYDVPLLQWMPGLSKSCTNTKHEWLEDELVPMETTTAEALDSSETGVDVATGTGKYFRADDILKVGDEVLLVTSVSTDTLTVVRGHGSTSGASHDSGATIYKIGVAKPEGSDANEPISTVKTAGYNYSQIFMDTVKVTGTREAILQYGVSDEYAYQLSKVLKNRAIAVEQAIIHGVRDEDATNHRRTMGGLLEFTSTNVVDAASASLTKATLDHLLHDIWRAGGSPRDLVMNIDQKAALYKIYEDRIRKAEGDRGLGGYIEYFENDLGRFNIILDRWVPRDKILVLDREKLGFGPLQGRNWSHTYMGQKGDYRHGMLLGEFTMEVRGEKSHGVIKNLAYTA